jgi:hypothetical protein
MKKLALAGFVVAVVGVIGVAQAAQKDDPTGTWKWKTKFGKDGGKEIERTMKLELKGDKLTGTVSGFGKQGTDTKIEDGSFKNGELSFTTTVERGDMKFTTKYSGKLTGDTIKGTITSERGGKENKQDWEAKRAGKQKD